MLGVLGQRGAFRLGSQGFAQKPVELSHPGTLYLCLREVGSQDPHSLTKAKNIADVETQASEIATAVAHAAWQCLKTRNWTPTGHQSTESSCRLHHHHQPFHGPEPQDGCWSMSL